MLTLLFSLFVAMVTNILFPLSIVRLGFALTKQNKNQQKGQKLNRCLPRREPWSSG
jgi:hypothetical protein